MRHFWQKMYCRFFLPFLLVQMLAAQSNVSIRGEVRDADSGLPLSDVNIWGEHTAFGATSDENGRFVIENIPSGNYTVLFSLVGYQEARQENIIINKEMPAWLSLALIPNPIISDSIEIIGNREVLIAAGDRQILSEKDIERYEALGLPQLLQQVAGVQVESGGGAGSRATIRIHGSRANQVLALLDGQRLNDPQTGEVDLNQIPISQVEKIEIIKQGNAAIYGSHAFGGVIAFHTKKVRNQTYGTLGGQMGAFETASGEASLALAGEKNALQISYTQDYSRQNFAYIYEDEAYRRANAWYRNRNLFLKLDRQTTRTQSTIRFQHRDEKQGLPSSLFEEMDHFNAFRDGFSQSFQFHHRRIFSKKNIVDADFNFYRTANIFDNEKASNPFRRYKTDQDNRIYEGKLGGIFSLKKNWELQWTTIYLEEQLFHENVLFPDKSIGEKRRHALSGGFSSDLRYRVPFLFKNASLRTAIRYESYFGKPGKGYPAISAGFTPEKWSFLTISGGWAKAIRYPDFNSLFWKGDTRARGNPDLQPEQKDSWHGSLRFNFSPEWLPAFYAYYYSENIRDLIFWHRTFNGIWEPRNETQAEKQGWDLQLRQPLFRENLQLQAGYSFIDAINKSPKENQNRRGKRIIFIPEHTINISLSAQVSGWQALLIYRHVSEREVVAANTANQLAAYELWDASIAYKKQFKRLHITTSYAIKNFTESQYQLLRGFPMPGMDMQGRILLKYHWK